MVIYKTDKKVLYCTGDIHGEFGVLMNFVDRFMSDCVIICCGDIGMGFHKQAYYENQFSYVNKRLADRNVEFYMLRGNHDDPAYFMGDRDYGFIHLVPDYSVLKTGDGTTVLMIGGATSVDRLDRISYDLRNKHKYLLHHGNLSDILQTYWTDESPVYDAVKLEELLKAGIKPDMVCTHTCPSFCFPSEKLGIRYFLEMDETLESDIDAERSVMDNIWNWLCDNGLKPKVWCYGHYHNHNVSEIDGTLFVLLDMCRENRNQVDAYEVRLTEKETRQ